MKLPHLILLTACTVTGASHVYASPLPPVLDSSVGYRSAMLQPASATDAVTNQLIMRLDQLQATLTTLQAKVDQQAVSINGLQRVQNAVNTTVDARLNNLDIKASVPTTATPVIVNTPTALPVIAQAPVILSSEQQRYQSAYATFRAGNIDKAMADFQKIIKDYPTGSLADNAQYWLGEAYLLKGKKQEAMQAFDRVVLAYPKSNKVPDALLKLGFVQLSLNNRIKAKEYLDYIIINHSGTSAANLAMRKVAQAGL